MNWNRTRLLGLSFALTILSGCGNNTEDPVYPLLTVISPQATPTVVSVSPVEVISLEDQTYNIEFDLSYYVTNEEDDFLGYNLYISSSTQASDMDGTGAPYLPEGVAPTFEHKDDAASQASEDLVTQRVSYFSPPPAITTFAHCNQYNFRMSAVNDQGVESSQGVAVTACATVRPWLCDTSSACYQALP